VRLKRQLNMASKIALVIGPSRNLWGSGPLWMQQFACSAFPLNWKLRGCCYCNVNAWVNWLQLHLRHRNERGEMPPKVFCSIEAFDCTPLHSTRNSQLRRKLQLQLKLQSVERWWWPHSSAFELHWGSLVT